MCEISWIDDNGDPTPDDSAPIGRVRCKVYAYERGFPLARKPWEGDWSRWFTICAKHAKELDKPSMIDWEFEAVANFEITFVHPNGDWTWIYESAPDFHDAMALALDKCPIDARVKSVVAMTPAQIDANKGVTARVKSRGATAKYLCD